MQGDEITRHIITRINAAQLDLAVAQEGLSHQHDGCSTESFERAVTALASAKDNLEQIKLKLVSIVTAIEHS